MERLETGIRGLDELLGGGFPRGKTILVVGSPGSGKTTFAIQYLYRGALLGERGLYISMDEPPENVKSDLSSFGWDLDGMEKSGRLIFVDATPLKRSGEAEELEEEGYKVQEMTFQGLIRTIRKIVDEEGISRIAVDPITPLMLRYETPLERRRALLIFFENLSRTKCTSIVTTELRTSIFRRSFQLEEFLSQGVILLHSIFHAGNLVRAIQIEKMRGIAHDVQLRPYRIGKDGIEIFPRDKIFE
ncbi:MAG: ATPase domain-containing protein [Candidatus Bathyarchaeia archaeon]